MNHFLTGVVFLTLIYKYKGMAFTKGEDEKRGRGRPPGTKNKTTAQIKEAFQQILSGSIDQLISDLAELEPKDRIALLLKMSDKIVPSLKSVDQVIETKGDTSLGFVIKYTEDEGNSNKQ